MTPVLSSGDRSGRSARTVVHLVRHGEVENPQMILYGRLPGYHLSERGRKMAEGVAEALALDDVALVVSSPLERAQQTAAPIAVRHGLGVLTDERTLEAANYFQGKRFGHGAGSLRRPPNWVLVANPIRPSWGEPYRQISDRMIRAIDGAREHARGHAAVIVSHQLPIWAVRSSLEGRRLWHDPRRRECGLASITTLRFVGDDLEAIAYTEPVAHLAADANPVPGA